MRRTLLLPLGIVLLSLPLFAACTDDADDDSSTATASVSATAADSTTATVSASPVTPAADGPETGQQTPWTAPSDPDPATALVVLRDVRMGVHPEEGGWERIVFEFDGTVRPAATIEYVEQATQCGSGNDVAIDGAAILQVAIVGADAHDLAGPTVPATIDGPGAAVIGGQQTCDFEAHVTWDFGLDAKRNFKVTTLTGPTRIVVDVKQ